MSVSLYGGTLTLTIEAGLSATATTTYGVWDLGLWNTATWGPDVTWTDISSDVRAISTARRFSRDVKAWEAGTATIVLNNRSGNYSPDNLSGTYVSAGVTQIRPWRPVRVRATYAGTVRDVYRGYITDWHEGWAINATGKGDAIVTLAAVDELGRLAGFNGLQQSAVGAGEYAGYRVHRLLNNAGHAGERAIDVGVFTAQATTLASNVVTELKLTADSDGGAVFVDTAGTVVFQDGYALIEETRSNASQVTYGDGGGSELPYASIDSEYNGDLVTNIASWARAGGTAQTSTDNASRALYGDRRSSRTDLLNASDADVAQLAAWEVIQYAEPERRIKSVTFKPRRSATTLFPEVLDRRVRDLVTVNRQPPGGYTISQKCHVAGIEHQITPADWTTTIHLWSATPYQTVGRWDYATWDTSKWFF